MTPARIRVGLIDSGLSEKQSMGMGAARRFVADDYGGMHQTAVTPDLLGHGTTVAGIILYHAPDVVLYNAQVFDARGVTSPASVAAALDWLTEEKVDVINMSLGLLHDREILSEACASALSRDVVLIASSPAQGGAVFPAAYPGVIRATGDARCDLGEISFLDNRQADFGACPRDIAADPSAPPRIGGGSLGCAHVTGHVAAYLGQGCDKSQIRQWLASRSKYLHSERRIK